jgi:enediyne biosynthesis protein E5
MDARWLQITLLGTLLLVGVWWRDFSLQAPQILFTFAASLAVQYLAMRWLHIKLNLLSALVTSFGICLLVRADSFWVHPLVASIAIGSKFIITSQRQHIFNPANFAAVVAGYALPGAWLSPGQWGQDPVLASLFCLLGLAVTIRAKRWDVALMFIGSFALLILLRALWIEARLATVLHTLMNGSLLLFTFFMISDPMTTPQRRWVRMSYAFAVALLAVVWQYTQFKPNGPVLALFALSLAVPLLNRCWPAKRFDWANPRS